MIVYQHRRLDTNEIFYIGIGKTERRAYSIHSRSKFWKHIVNKYGYTVEIVCTCDTWEEACQIEQYLIKFYGRKDLGLGNLVNMTDGGEGVLNHTHSDETKAKMSESKKNLPESFRQRMSEINKGRKHSEETILKMSESAKRRKPSVTRLVLDTQTGIFYETITEASFYYDIKYQTLWNMLKGQNPNKTNLIII